MQAAWNLSDHIDQFRDPSLYPHETDPEIRVLQTHISYVVLTGPYAYKLKKPVDMGFLNFTTLKRRRHYCEEELRLNRVFAPELYEDMVEIRWDGEQVSIAPRVSGDGVDYAVKMKQFDDEDLLSRIFERDELDSKLIIQLARRIARAHRAANAITGKSYGNAATMRDSVEVIESNLRPFVGSLLQEDTWQMTTSFLHAFLEDQEWLFDLRINEGRIRECHGDLHLGNICLYNNTIELFDRIEFNDEFKNIDVMYDIAFLLMDLRFRERSDLATLLLNTYAELTGDYVGVSMLRFYECVRALIRSEVAGLLLNEVSADSSIAEKARTDCVGYLELARTYAARPAGGLIVVCGVSGSGKSTIARSLTAQGDFVHVRSDAIRKHLAGIDLHDAHEYLYTSESTDRTYRHLIETGVVLASRGHRVILDAQFGKRKHRLALAEKAEGLHLPLRFVECQAPAESIRERLDSRTEDISDAKSDLIQDQQKDFEPFMGQECESHITLDTSDPHAIQEVLSDIIGALTDTPSN